MKDFFTPPSPRTAFRSLENEQTISEGVCILSPLARWYLIYGNTFPYAAGRMDTGRVISSTHATDYYTNVNNVVSEPITQNSIWAITPLKGTHS